MFDARNVLMVWGRMLLCARSPLGVHGWASAGDIVPTMSQGGATASLSLVSPVGFAELQPRNGRPKGNDSVALCHRLTGEQVRLGDDFREQYLVRMLPDSRFALQLLDCEL